MNKLLKLNFQTIILVLGLILVCLSFNLFNQQEKISAQNQNLICDTKIPIGESVDISSDLLNDIYIELEAIYHTIPKQIEAAQEMVTAARKCNLDNCQPVCVDISCYADFKCEPSGTCPCEECICSSEDCSPNCSCDCGDESDNGCCSCEPFCIAKCVEKTCKGKICPDLEFPNQLVNNTFEKINHSFQEINNLYGNNTKEIREKLDQARTEFNNCAKNIETKTIRCRDILNQDGQFPLEKIEECKSVCEENKKTTEINTACLECICGSSINYFCCR